MLEVIVGGNEVMKPKCTVHINNSTDSFDDFITLGFDKNSGTVKVMHNCDILTISLGMDILHNTLNDMYNMMPQDQRDIVDKYFEEAKKDEKSGGFYITPITSQSNGHDDVPCETHSKRSEH